MKVLLFNYREKFKYRKVRKPINFERFLYTAFLATFVILLIVQAALLNPSVRSSITARDGIEGAPLGVEEYLYNEGSMELQLLNEDSSPALKVLVNGEERVNFESKSVEITVIDGDVIEVDGSGVENGAEIAVSSVSTNMEKEYIGKKFRVGKGVLKIVKVKMTAQ